MGLYLSGTEQVGLMVGHAQGLSMTLCYLALVSEGFPTSWAHTDINSIEGPCKWMCVFSILLYILLVWILP